MSTNGNGSKNGRGLNVLYNCSKCPAYCCSYDLLDVGKRDLLRIAKHFGLSYEQAEKRYTKITGVKRRVLRVRKDHIYKTVCGFLDQTTRKCTIYDARPAVCRDYPEARRCGYYDFLAFERRHQCDDEFIPDA